MQLLQTLGELWGWHLTLLQPNTMRALLLMKHKACGLAVVMTQAHHGTLCNMTAFAVKSRKCDCDCEMMKPTVEYVRKIAIVHSAILLFTPLIFLLSKCEAFP